MLTLILAAVFQGQAPAGRGSLDYRLETSELISRMAYANPEKVSNNVSPVGAYGDVNREYERTGVGKWYIEEQRYGDLAIAAGLAGDDPAAIERGLRIFNWGLARQQPDGSFRCRDAFQSTSLFVEAVARACLLLEQSPVADRYRAAVAAMKPKILVSARWMVIPAVANAARPGNAPYTHRRYLVAAALGEAGVLCGDPRLIAAAQPYLAEGRALQTAEGIHPEKGGFDTSYQAVGLLYGLRYYTLVARPNEKAPLAATLAKGLAWLASRVQPDGSINPEGNTRTGGGQENNRAGRPKSLNYGATFRAFEYWALISSADSYHKLAERVAEFDRAMKRATHKPGFEIRSIQQDRR